MPSNRILVTGVESGLGKYVHKSITSSVGLRRDNRQDICSGKEFFDTIIHCAFNTHNANHNNIPDYYKYIDDNILLTDQLTKVPHNKFVYISSVSVYEPRLTAYKYTKLFAESIVQKNASLPLILRCTSMLGRYMRKNTLTKIIENPFPVISLTNNSTFDYILHKDVCSFILKTLWAPLSGVYDFSSSASISLIEVCNIINSNTKYGDYCFGTPKSDNKRIGDIFPEYNKTSIETLKEYLSDIK